MRAWCLWIALVLSNVLMLGSSAPQPPDARKPIDFAAAARAVMQAIQRDLYNPQTGLYAQSTTKRDPEFMWGNGVMFSALVAATRADATTYRPLLDRFFAAMDRYWDAKAPIPGYEPAPTAGNGHDKYYDDNQWMVITFLEAYDTTKDARYLDRAEQTLRFSLSGWDDQLGGGIWWHEGHKGGGKNTCANAPAAVAALRLARRRNVKDNIEWARRITAWTTRHLQDTDGLFFDNIRVADSRLGKRKFTYNSALMIRANLGLFRVTREAKYLDEAKRIGAACTEFVQPSTGGYRDGMKFTHLLVEADLELFRATGDDTIMKRATRNGDAAWMLWQSTPPQELIERAAMARMFWLLAESRSEAGKVYWNAADLAAPDAK